MMWNVFCSILETFLIFGVGIYAFKKKMIESQDVDKLSRLTLDVFFPMLTFATIVQNIRRDNLNDLWVMPLAGLALMGFGALIGWPLKRYMKNSSRRRRGTFHHICAINNYVFLPLLVLQNLYGVNSRPVALILLMNVGSTVGFWTLGVITFKGGTTWDRALKAVLSVNVVAVFIALFFVLTAIPLPQVLLNVTSRLGNLSVPFMLVVIGVALYQCHDKLFADKTDMLILSFWRLIGIPFCLMFLLKLLPLSREQFQVLFIVALMPAASTSVLIARKNGGSEEFAGQMIVATTLLSLLTIPFMLWVYSLFFGKL